MQVAVDRGSRPPVALVLRSLAAVVGGYLIFALPAFALFALSGRAPYAPQPLWFVVTATLWFAGLGGFVAARVSPARPLLHAAGVAFVLALGATVSLLTSPGTSATWSQWTALALMAPSAYVGGRLAARAEGA
jgi:hypothetical protein